MSLYGGANWRPQGMSKLEDDLIYAGMYATWWGCPEYAKTLLPEIAITATKEHDEKRKKQNRYGETIQSETSPAKADGSAKSYDDNGGKFGTAYDKWWK